MSTVSVLSKPQILGRATNTNDFIIQVPEKDWLGIYSLYFQDDPILSAAEDAKNSEEVFETYDDLLHDLTH